MPLDPHARRLLNMLAAGAATPAGPQSAAAMRSNFAALAGMMNDGNAPVGRIENFTIAGPGGPLALRRYIPVDIGDRRPPAPALLYFHGGAWVFCGLDTHDGLCRALCHHGSIDVIAVAYRQAPEHKFPAPMDDAAAALDWLMASSVQLGLDPHRIAIGGDSAGATLAIGACLAARDAGKPVPALQLLLCPKTDVLPRTASRAEFSSGYFLDEATIAWALEQLCPPGTDFTDWRLSPLGAPDLAGLPLALIHTAECDPLRDEGDAFAKRLREAGVPVTYVCHTGMIHHFYGLAAAIPYAKGALQAIAASVADRLRRA